MTISKIGKRIFISLLIYLLTAFIKWDLYIPFKWMLEIPNWSHEDRFFLVFTIGLFLLIYFMITRPEKFGADPNNKYQRP